MNNQKIILARRNRMLNRHSIAESSLTLTENRNAVGEWLNGSVLYDEGGWIPKETFDKVHPVGYITGSAVDEELILVKKNEKSERVIVFPIDDHVKHDWLEKLNRDFMESISERMKVSTSLLEDPLKQKEGMLALEKQKNGTDKTVFWGSRDVNYMHYPDVNEIEWKRANEKIVKKRMDLYNDRLKK